MSGIVNSTGARSGVIGGGGGPLETDEISEKTTDNGVEIDGMIVKDSALVDSTDKHPALSISRLASGVSASKAFLKTNNFSFNAHMTTAVDAISATMTEMGSGCGWTFDPGGGSGTATFKADPFDKFGQSTGRFTPTHPGYYFFSCFFTLGEDLGSGDYFMVWIHKNGEPTGVHVPDVTDVADSIAFLRHYMPLAEKASYSLSGVINLDADDYVSCWIKHNYGSNREISNGRFSGFYIGENL